MTETQIAKSAAKRSSRLPLSLLMFSMLISAGQPHLGIGGSWAWLLRLLSALLFAASVVLALTRNAPDAYRRKILMVFLASAGAAVAVGLVVWAVDRGALG